MSHQPFEDWIVGDEALTLDQRQALEAHLSGCPACADLATSLAAVDRTFGESAAVAPQAGFGLRFARKLGQSRVRVARRQGWGTFAGAVIAAALLATPMALKLGAEWNSPGEMVVQMLIRGYDLWVGLRVAGGCTRAALSNLSEIVPPAWVVGFLAACLGTGAVWMAVLFRFAFRRVKEGVER